ncbi:hypothetical protein Val02_55860 [Virgisporangium aliadipatigenens]|uniref:Uncharacterized protein n=1 Tax=Virgisporangium aliadipatigenens TaxID=741659 RepID=A0A8J4DS09_9ACTN|nr:hypothetical protein [Virgisporangium aliadipatigenens]GIJ48700.1 hypothetical protein Val02_55860 [Virgisporangium aliadipatigenens]
MSEAQWRDEERLPLAELDRAMATYSHDGQADDATGNDAGAELEFGDGSTARRPGRPSPDGPTVDGRTGPN